MFFKWMFRKKISISRGEELLTEYCKENGFDDNTTQWKDPTYRKHLISYHRRSSKMISNNWVAYHLFRRNDKYSIWIDLVTKEIREVSRNNA